LTIGWLSASSVAHLLRTTDRRHRWASCEGPGGFDVIMGSAQPGAAMGQG
jgi:hypothetical protein